MKLELNFELENNRIPFDFRKGIISFLKNALSEYNQSFYNDIYNYKKKDLTFCPFMQFEKQDTKDRVFYLKDKSIKVILSSGDDKNIYKLFVSLQKQVNKKYPFYDNSLVLKSISSYGKKMSELDFAIIKVSKFAPLVIMDHQVEIVDGKRIDRNWCYTFESPQFVDLFKFKTGLDIIPLENCKKVVYDHFGMKIPASYGNFFVKGSVSQINDILNNGAGDRKSQGFGYITLA